MAAIPPARKSIAAIRMLMGTTPAKLREYEMGLSQACYNLQRQAKQIIEDPNLLDEVLQFAREISAFRGRGSQMIANDISRLFSSVIREAMERLLDVKCAFSSFHEARIMVPSREAIWSVLEKTAGRATSCIQGPPSRSGHVSFLRAQGWRQLAAISEVVRELGWLELALQTAGNKKLRPDEREAAIEFLREFWNGDTPDAATESLLGDLEKDPPTRSFLVSVMQAQIDMGLSSEFAALNAVDRWDDADHFL